MVVYAQRTGSKITLGHLYFLFSASQPPSAETKITVHRCPVWNTYTMTTTEFREPKFVAIRTKFGGFRGKFRVLGGDVCVRCQGYWCSLCEHGARAFYRAFYWALYRRSLLCSILLSTPLCAPFSATRLKSVFSLRGYHCLLMVCWRPCGSSALRHSRSSGVVFFCSEKRRLLAIRPVHE